jgi:hypothetical protein
MRVNFYGLSNMIEDLMIELVIFVVVMMNLKRVDLYLPMHYSIDRDFRYK